MFPPLFNQAVMFGQGIAGIVACVLNIAVLLALGGVNSTVAMVNYVIAAIAMAGCIVAYVIMLQRPFSKYWISMATRRQVPHVNSSNAVVDVSKNDGEAGSPAAPKDSQSAREPHLAETTKLISPPDTSLAGSSQLNVYSFFGVTRVLWLEAFSMWLLYVITFAIFPGVAPFHLDYYKDTAFNVWWQQVRSVAFLTH